MEDNIKNKIITKKKGIVVSKGSNKAAVVSIDVFKTHAKYKKKYKVTKRYNVHDEENKSKVGDMVEIISIKPASKNKSFKVKY